MKMEKCTIIIPVYNTSIKLLQACVNSANMQDYPNIEILLVDDGSTAEETINYMNELSNRNIDRLHIINIKNSGPSVARYEGALKARGHYITFLDSDDIIAPTMISTLASMMDERCDLACVDEQSVADIAAIEYKEGDISYAEWREILGGEKLLQGLYGLSDEPRWYNLHGEIFKRNAFLERVHSYKDIRMGEDRLTNAEYLANPQTRVRICQKPLYYYMTGNMESVTHKPGVKSMTLAFAMDRQCELCQHYGYETIIPTAERMVAECIISAFSVGAKNGQLYKQIVSPYAELARKYKKSLKLGRSNKIKFFFILYFPRTYYLILRMLKR